MMQEVETAIQTLAKLEGIKCKIKLGPCGKIKILKLGQEKFFYHIRADPQKVFQKILPTLYPTHHTLGKQPQV